MNQETINKLADLNRRLNATLYSFEFDTEDVVLGFKKTNKTSTRKLAKALSMERKLRSDLGKFISPSVRITAIRLYRNNELRGSFAI